MREPLQVVAPLQSPAHKTMREHIRKARLSEQAWRELAWKTNAHWNLICFPQICSNLLTILELIPARWQVSLEDYRLETWVPVLGVFGTSGRKIGLSTGIVWIA
jgi:hypothetical protein